MLNPTQLENFLQRRYGAVKRSRGKHGLELITKCPVCGKKKLSVNANTGHYQCWHGCISGHIDSLLGDVKIARIDAATRPAPVGRQWLDPGTVVPLSGLEDDHHVITYLKRRGFDPKLLETTYGLRYCTEGKPFAKGFFNTTNTLIIPVYMGGELIGWQSRLLYDPDKIPDEECGAMGFQQDPDGEWLRPPKYFTMPGINKAEILWNYDWARQSRIVVICEGVFDAIAVGRCAVATFGKGVSEHQRGYIGAYWDLAIALLDPDAETENLQLKQSLDAVIPTVCLSLKGYKDAGEAPQLEIWRQIDQAMQANNPPLKLENYRFII